MASPQVTVTGNFIDLTGIALTGYCAFSIFSPTGATEFKIASTGQIIPNRIATGLGTSISQLLFGNDVISDLSGNLNTLWNVTCYSASNQSFWDFLYIFNGTNTFNLVSTAPTNPPPTLPAPLNSQTANTVYAGPSGGGPAVPTFRSLATSDIPLNLTFSTLTSASANPASTGRLRLSYTASGGDGVCWRSQSNLTDYCLFSDGYGGVPLVTDVLNWSGIGITAALYAGNTSAFTAQSGLFRMLTTESACWRNNANSADTCLSKNSSDQLQFNSINVADVSSSQTFTNKTLTSPTLTGTVVASGATIAGGPSFSGGLTSSGITLSSATTLGISANAQINLAVLLAANTAPTISSHFNSSGDSISASNGTAAFTVTVGTGAAGSTGAVGLPTAATGWICNASNRNRGAYIQQTGSTTATATFTNYGTTVGTPVNWTNSDVLAISCSAY
jgi:hypothetical protein